MRLAALLILMIAGSARTAVFGIDDQVVERGTPPGLGALGVVTRGVGVSHATGFLVGDCEVLTVKHAAGHVRSALGRRLDFAQPGAGGRRSRGTVVDEGDLDLINAWYSRDRSGDWLLIRLDRCLGRTVGFATLSAVPFHQSGHWLPGTANLHAAGFPGPRWRAGLTRDPNCRVRALRDGLLLNDCAAHAGSSGSPLFVVSGKGSSARLIVFGLQSATSDDRSVVPWSLDRSSIAVPVDVLVPRIARHLTRLPTAASPVERGAS